MIPLRNISKSAHRTAWLHFAIDAKSTRLHYRIWTLVSFLLNCLWLKKTHKHWCIDLLQKSSANGCGNKEFINASYLKQETITILYFTEIHSTGSYWCKGVNPQCLTYTPGKSFAQLTSLWREHELLLLNIKRSAIQLVRKVKWTIYIQRLLVLWCFHNELRNINAALAVLR